MSESRIKEIRDRLEKATDGDWSWEGDPPTIYAGRTPFVHGSNLFGRLEPDANGKNNLDFVVNAKSDIRYLLNLLKEKP